MKAAILNAPQDRSARRRLPLSRRDMTILVFGWLAASALLIVVDQAGLILSRQQALKYREGDVVSEDFVLEADFSFQDEQATQKVVALNRSLAPPVYEVRSEITDSVLERFDRFAAGIEPALTGTGTPTGISDLRTEFPGAAGILDRESVRSVDEVRRILSITRDVLEYLQLAGIFQLDDQDGGAASGVVEVIYSGNLPERRITLIRDALTISDNLARRIRDFDELGSLDVEDIEFIAALATYFAEPNGYLNRDLTERNRDDAESATEPVVISVTAGTRLLSKGEVVSARQARILEALRNRRAVGYHSYVDPVAFLAIVFALGLVTARSFGITLGQTKSFWLFVFLGGIYLLIASVFVGFLPVGEVSKAAVMPTALSTLLLAQLLQDRRMAVLTSILMALLMFFLSDGNGHEMLITLSAGIGGTLAVRRRETRMGLLRAGPRLAVIMFLAAFLSGMLARLPWRASLVDAGAAAANGLITGVLSLAFLPLLEHVLNTATTFRLIELSDQNVPVLKRMRIQAPGTYIHSQNVAHLAEAACDAVGANGLLARVGAYYHDIGKVDQAHLFVENQNGENKHDDLKATLSVAVIKSHVKIGMEKGRELRLPDEVLAVIEQHHGTSVIKYFYDRAMKESNGESISPEAFSYGGPKPHSREAAIVMLADSAEAATRTLKKPTAAKLEKYVWDLIMDRFKSGELNDSDLTLSDLETVKESFVQVLTGHFHSRIEYPKDADSTG